MVSEQEAQSSGAGSAAGAYGDPLSASVGGQLERWGSLSDGWTGAHLRSALPNSTNF